MREKSCSCHSVMKIYITIAGYVSKLIITHIAIQQPVATSCVQSLCMINIICREMCVSMIMVIDRERSDCCSTDVSFIVR